MSKKKKKKKKEKVIYYDDNSTISDMSQVTRIGQKKPSAPPAEPRRKSTFGVKWKTYWSAVRRMLLPMCVVLLILLLLYLLLIFIF